MTGTLFPTKAGAIFGPGRTHRYRLWRAWGNPEHRCCFLMLNPSVADETALDPTVTRCVGFAKRWGFGALDVVNIFALVSTESLGLLNASDPIGPGNDKAITEVTGAASRVVMAWGSHKKSKALASLVVTRAREVRAALHLANSQKVANREWLGHLGTNADGMPKHPLYLASKTPFHYAL